MSQHDPSPRDMLFQGTHIAHSDGRMVTMLPTPCTAADQHADSPRCPPRRSGTSCPADSARAWHHRRTGARCGAVSVITYRVSRAHTKEKKGPMILKDFLSLSFSSFLPL